MDEQNTGSFGAAIGGSSALKEAMERRGIDASVLQQTSPGSVAGAQVAPAPTETQAASAALGQTSQATAPEAPVQDSDMQIALKALAGVVKNESNLKKSVVEMKQMGIA